ncbi:hypothetical protein JCM19235_4982 [Vibrio maritimus]|uniref:Uncharacterized protein n=1 Tax=Vibrio maritimus TaxID=990268 RepID=A0A090S1C8_9VIBR|nr:hypothetical protein JCM19235_4982 [Vibrio maritimus]
MGKHIREIEAQPIMFNRQHVVMTTTIIITDIIVGAGW